MRRLPNPLRRHIDILTLARNLWVLGIVVYHVARTAAASCVDVLFYGRGDEVLGFFFCAGFSGVDVSCASSAVGDVATCHGVLDSVTVCDCCWRCGIGMVLEEG